MRSKRLQSYNQGVKENDFRVLPGDEALVADVKPINLVKIVRWKKQPPHYPYSPKMSFACLASRGSLRSSDLREKPPPA